MILTGSEIKRQYEQGRIKISHFDENCLSTNSHDLRLGTRLLRYTCEVLDPRENNSHEIIDMTSDGYQLQRNEFVLAETAEMIGSDHYVPLIHARSSTARLGLFVHITADLIDIGSYGRSTLQLYATAPVRIYPLMKIAQVTFWQPHGQIKLYDGKYAGSDGPVPSLAYRDFTVAS
jgi:dCTP deaminase